MAAIKKVPLHIDLEKAGYPGEHLVLHLNMSQKAHKAIWNSRNADAPSLYIEHGLILEHSFTDEDGKPLAASDIPWDAIIAAHPQLFEAMMERQMEVLKIGQPAEQAEGEDG